MKKLTVLSVVPAALVMASGTVVAVPPTGFSYDDYTANAGAITASCPVGYTCTNLDATGNGILQQRVTNGVDSFFRTIVLDEGTTAADLASVEALGFRNESYIAIANPDDSNAASGYAIRGIIQGDGPLLLTNTNSPIEVTDSYYTYSEISSGDLSIGGPVILEQRNVLGATAGTGAITRAVDFKANGPSNNMNMQINAIQPNNEGNITIRKGTATAAGNLELTDADASIAPLAYAAGNRLQVVWLEQAASGAGDAFNRILGQQIYSNLTTGTEIRYNNNDGAGNFVAVNTGAGNEVGGIGPWNWNAALFGTEPNPYLVNAAGTGIAQPAVTFP